MSGTGTHPDSSRIMDIAQGFWPAKTLLAAVELELFTAIGADALDATQICQRVGLHPRPVYDFLDALVALRVLERNGLGPKAKYRNSPQAATFLDSESPHYIGGWLDMLNTRLYPFWGHLTEALRSGQAQSESKDGGEQFEELYRDPMRVRQFIGAMSGISAQPFHELADRVDFSRYPTLCDIGGASGQLSIILARRYPHLHCTTFDLPVVESLAHAAIDAAGLGDRITVVSGDFLVDPFPRADVITMGMILHDWNLDKKKQLIATAHEALPEHGALIIIEHLIDDERRENLFGLMMSLNMLIEYGDGFDFTGADLTGWCHDVGFSDVEIHPLPNGHRSVAIARK